MGTEKECPMKNLILIVMFVFSLVIPSISKSSEFRLEKVGDNYNIVEYINISKKKIKLDGVSEVQAEKALRNPGVFIELDRTDERSLTGTFQTTLRTTTYIKGVVFDSEKMILTTKAKEKVETNIFYGVILIALFAITSIVLTCMFIIIMANLEDKTEVVRKMTEKINPPLFFCMSIPFINALPVLIYGLILGIPSIQAGIIFWIHSFCFIVMLMLIIWLFNAEYFEKESEVA